MKRALQVVAGVVLVAETFSGRMLPMIEGSLPDFTSDFTSFARDLKTAAEKVAPPGG